MTTPLERRDHVAGEVDKPARAERSELDRQIDVLLQNDVSLTSRAQARRRMEAGEGVLGAASAAAAPTAYEIPGQLLARKQAQQQQRKQKPPKGSDFERGSSKDWAGR